MTVQLHYHHGSRVRDERLSTEGLAVVRAGELLYALDCSGFEITDETGRVLRGDPEVRRAYARLWKEDLEPSFEAAVPTRRP
jgi:hypothetical protein